MENCSLLGREFIEGLDGDDFLRSPRLCGNNCLEMKYVLKYTQKLME